MCLRPWFFDNRRVVEGDFLDRGKRSPRFHGMWVTQIPSEGRMQIRTASTLGIFAAFLLVTAHASSTDARQAVAKLDTVFQAAVKANDAQSMERILGENMILVLGDGTTNTRAVLLQEARNKTYVYEHQEEDSGTQTVRVWGDTAVVTARLWIKGVNQ